MVKIRVRTREMKEDIFDRRMEMSVPEIKEKEKETIELTPDIDPDDIIAIESEDYEIESRFSTDAYDEYLDEIYPSVKIGYVHYDASRIISELDPVVYRIGYDEWRTEQEKYIAEEMVDEEPEFLASPTYWENVLSHFPFPQFPGDIEAERKRKQWKKDYEKEERMLRSQEGEL